MSIELVLAVLGILITIVFGVIGAKRIGSSRSAKSKISIRDATVHGDVVGGDKSTQGGNG